jgi:hypothetical protein
MVIALSIAVGGTILAVIFFAGWVTDLRFRSLQQDAELRSLRGTLDRVAQDVVTLWSGDRRRLLAERVNAVPTGLARAAEPALESAAAADSSPASPTGGEEEMRALSSPSPVPKPGHGDSSPPSAPRQRMPPDVAALLVRSLAGGDRGPRDESPGAAVISGAQEELALVAEMLLAIDTKFREAWPEPPAIGNVLTALSDRILAGLELLSHEGGGAPPPAANDDEPPSSSDPGGGALPH